MRLSSSFPVSTNEWMSPRENSFNSQSLNLVFSSNSLCELHKEALKQTSLQTFQRIDDTDRRLNPIVEVLEAFGNTALPFCVWDSELRTRDICPFGAWHFRSRTHNCRSHERFRLNKVEKISRQDAFGSDKHPCFRRCRAFGFNKGKLPQVWTEFPKYDVVRAAKVLETVLPSERRFAQETTSLRLDVFKFNTGQRAVGYRRNFLVSPLCYLAKCSVTTHPVLLENDS